MLGWISEETKTKPNESISGESELVSIQVIFFFLFFWSTCISKINLIYECVNNYKAKMQN